MNSVKPTIPEVLPRFEAYYAMHPSWGSLHIVLEDGNVEDGHVISCIKWAEERGDIEGKALAEILLTMSKTQRGKLANVIH